MNKEKNIERPYLNDFCEKCIYHLNNTTFNVNLTANGKSMTIAEWARHLGVNVNTLYSRYRKGLSAEEIINKPIGKYTRVNRR